MINVCDLSVKGIPVISVACVSLTYPAQSDNSVRYSLVQQLSWYFLTKFHLLIISTLESIHLKLSSTFNYDCYPSIKRSICSVYVSHLSYLISCFWLLGRGTVMFPSVSFTCSIWFFPYPVQYLLFMCTYYTIPKWAEICISVETELFVFV